MNKYKFNHKIKILMKKNKMNKNNKMKMQNSFKIKKILQNNKQICLKIIFNNRNNEINNYILNITVFKF